MDPMTPDDVRQELKRELEKRGIDMATASRALGRNHAYLQQFIDRGKPRYLHEEDRRGLADLYNIDVQGLVPPPKKSVERQVPLGRAPRPGDTIQDFREAAVVGAWRGLPQEDQEVFIEMLDALGRRRKAHPIAV